MIPRATAELYREQQRREAALILAVRRLWARMPIDGDWDVAWATIAPAVLSLVAAAQLDAFQAGAAMVPLALEQTGHPVEPVAQISAGAVTGYASDGRPLDALLDGVVPIARGAGSLRAGQAWLDTAVHLQVADAGRMGSSLAITARPGVGWVRMVNPPCCGNCAVLAGRFYRWSQGFARHYRCDCVHRPAHEQEGPDGYVETVPLDQIHDLTTTERQAVDDGADWVQVINARRGASRDKMFTVEGTTRRGLAYSAIRARHGAFAEAGKAGERYTRTTVARPTPEYIYARAKDRADALRLLSTYGYLW